MIRFGWFLLYCDMRSGKLAYSMVLIESLLYSNFFFAFQDKTIYTLKTTVVVASGGSRRAKPLCYC